ncbi:GAF domain-containing sensor histidine kinase [Nocardioides sp.]|uniref:sensor histidine kinase n=1 Tax=Nocardioides sp. TaxID=35761 RepID=UPI002B27409F|nr:GAF domain-containing sensor histidine kinase [Nocardioides sp.]
MTPELGSLDHYARLVRRSLGAPVGLVTLIQPDRQVFVGADGLPGELQAARETPLSHSFCQYVVADEGPVIVRDVREAERLADNLAITDLGTVAYAGWPITDHEGHTIGSLCAIDMQVHDWTEEDARNLSDLAAACSAELSQSEVIEEASELLAELRRSNEHLASLGSQVTHDLQNPLLALSGTLEMLNEENASTSPDLEMVGLLLSRAHRCVSRMSELLQDVMRYAVVGGELVLTEVDVIGLVASVLDDVPSLDRSLVELGDLPSVRADALQLRLLMQNVLANVAKYAGAAPTTVRAQVQGDRWVLEVADSGPGIARDQRERAFVAHERLDHSVPGSGLGLATCRRIALAHAGTIDLDETPGGGTTVRLSLPR